MDFYLTSVAAEAGEFIRFPVNPERVTLQTGSKLQTFEVIDLGDVTLPRGTISDRVSWEGVFPGSTRQNTIFVKDWRDPDELVGMILNWKDSGKKLQLMITETPVNQAVYIDTFDPEWGGGHGDCKYKVTFVQARELVILTDAEWQAKQGIQAGPVAAAAATATARPAPPPPKTYTVKSGDSLYAIAKQVLQDGSRWQEIYNANASVIGKNPNLIYPGQVFRIP